MSEGHENGLAKAASAYLRSARHQPIQWNEWGSEAFAQAAREDKPVLLDIGAVWCHWCHVMDRESYEDPATAAVINENFVAVKVDRDERPDVDTRYQAAVSAISGQGGWPLTAFLTPDGKPFFGGTYFPPDDRYGRPSFRRVLATMAEAFRTRREEVSESASSVMAAIEHSESFSGRSGDLRQELVGKLVESALKQFDERNGGFGSQPKFPHPGAIDLLIDSASRVGVDAERARTVATVTLRKMAEGGIHDQLAGGFHRYSVDERWIVPHFEKMAYDNSELLKNYVHAFQTFVEPEFARVAKGILRWMDEWLSDRERGGFYASQDADDSLDDDGDYFTWTRDEAKSALTAEEFAVAAEFLNIREIGDMHHNTEKNVLHVKGVPGGSQRALFEVAKRKMYAARLERKTPYVDKTIYTGWNGMCISAYLVAARGLDVPAAREFALRSLNRVLDVAWDADAGLAHVVAYGEGVAPSERVAGVLEDYGFLGNACVDAWEATGELRYYTVGKAIADAMIARFYDATGCGFF
ncbi:MAG: thioredoxin domain-containing protein, partial [Acidobacteriaceae bacterium]